MPAETRRRWIAGRGYNRAAVALANKNTRVIQVLLSSDALYRSRTHDYMRHATITLFATLDIATRSVVGEMHRRHRNTGFLRTSRPTFRRWLGHPSSTTQRRRFGDANLIKKRLDETCATTFNVR